MSVIYILIPLALVIVVGAVALFVWATRGGQFDDLDTPALRVLFDDEDGAGADAREEPTESGASPTGGGPRAH